MIRLRITARLRLLIQRCRPRFYCPERRRLLREMRGVRLDTLRAGPGSWHARHLLDSKTL